jgi:hypothetical protein
MYEAHLWLGLRDDTYEGASDLLNERVAGLAEFVRGQQALGLPTMKVELFPLNGTYYLTADVDANRRRDEAEWIVDLIARVNADIPASWGLLYERDDETNDWPGQNAFKVTVIARGATLERFDPFLSPCDPVIED